MKNFIFALLLLSSSIFFGCSNFTENNSDITNNSSKTVTFMLPSYGEETYTLNPGESLTKSLYSYPSCKILNPKNAVIYKSEKFGITFSDRKTNIYTCLIINNNDVNVEITEKYGLIGDNGEIFTIQAMKSVTITVYTKTPVLSAKDSNGNPLPIIFCLTN